MMLPTLALIGYGTMGREIEQAARELGYTVNAIIDALLDGHMLPLDESTLRDVDVCVEFTTPSSVLDNIRACAACGKNVVIGTTGWEERMDEVRAIVESSHIGLIHASNFSIGVHLFMRIVEDAARRIGRHEQYDVALQETHHRKKKDAPSGTALGLAKAILGVWTRKEHIDAPAPGEAIRDASLSVSSSRVGSVPGTHRVLFDSQADTIELIHTARNRRGFAEGALLAAKWIAGRKGLFTIEDMLHDIATI